MGYCADAKNNLEGKKKLVLLQLGKSYTTSSH